MSGCIFLRDTEPLKNCRAADFLCHCGVEFNARVYSVKAGYKTSCGCVYKSSRREINVIHGHSRRGVEKRHDETPEYRSWMSMKQRCDNPNNEYYEDYGGRGISVDSSWYDFTVFLEDMGFRPSLKHSLERRENNKGYSKWNCYWANKSEQANNRRSNVIVSYKGKSQTLKQWTDELGLNYKNIHKRIVYRGWSIEDAFTLSRQYGSRYISKRKVA